MKKNLRGVAAVFSGPPILILLMLLILPSIPSQAGVYEISAQANYRKTNYDSTHSEEEETGTGSIAYYFWDMSAVELSYTQGVSDQLEPQYTAFQKIVSYGADIMFTMADKDSSFKPYMKVGIAWEDKNLQYVINPALPPFGVETMGLAPTAGAGVKLMITQTLAIKFGIDVSSSPLFFFSEIVTPSTTSPPPNVITYDVSANAGVSFLF